jgi:hypothetical protein
MKFRVSPTLSIVVVVLVATVSALLLYASRQHEPVLYYYGGAPEVPNGTAIAIMNPFRDKRSEATAERLIADLRTNNCETIAKQFSVDARLCAVLENTHRARLVWRQDQPNSRVLVYQLPEKHARVWISPSREEPGFVVRSISVVR